MARAPTSGPTPREEQILTLLWDRGPMTAAQIRQELPSPPTASTVRKLLQIMSGRGLVADDGRDYAKRYRAVVGAAATRRRGLRRLVSGLYEGQATRVVEDLLDAGLVSPQSLRSLARSRSARDG